MPPEYLHILPNITWTSHFYLLCGILLSPLYQSKEKLAVSEEIDFYHRGLQFVLCHRTHLVILYWNQALTFRSSCLCWCICGFTFSKISLQPGIHDQIMGSFMLADLCSNSWTVSSCSSFISSAKNHSDRSDSSYLKEALGNDHLRQGEKTLFTSPYSSLLINISNWNFQRCFFFYKGQLFSLEFTFLKITVRAFIIGKQCDVLLQNKVQS